MALVNMSDCGYLGVGPIRNATHSAPAQQRTQTTKLFLTGQKAEEVGEGPVSHLAGELVTLLQHQVLVSTPGRL